MEMTNESPAKRLSLKLPVKFRRNYARKFSEGILKNISISGAYLILPKTQDINLDEKLTITFSVSGRKRQVIASVIWMDTTGCGIEFKPFNNRDVQIVDDLMFFVKSKKETRRNVLDNIFKVVS